MNLLKKLKQLKKKEKKELKETNKTVLDLKTWKKIEAKKKSQTKAILEMKNQEFKQEVQRQVSPAKYEVQENLRH